MAKAKISNLKSGTHRGRKTKTGKTRMSMVNHPKGISLTNMKADPRESAQVMTRQSPTPNGPEPGHGGLVY
jgi:hypothetical protein